MLKKDIENYIVTGKNPDGTELFSEQTLGMMELTENKAYIKLGDYFFDIQALGHLKDELEKFQRAIDNSK